MFRFTHFNFNVLDLDRSLSFYREALGLVPVREKEASDGSFKLVYLGDGVSDFTLELTWLRDRSDPYDLGDEEFHLAVYQAHGRLCRHQRHLRPVFHRALPRPLLRGGGKAAQGRTFGVRGHCGAVNAPASRHKKALPLNSSFAILRQRLFIPYTTHPPAISADFPQYIFAPRTALSRSESHVRNNSAARAVFQTGDSPRPLRPEYTHWYSWF